MKIQPLILRGAAALGRVALAICLLALSPWPCSSASIRQDANGFVVIQAEDFDLNLTQDTGEWQFDNTPLSWSLFDGWGYMKAFGAGGTNLSASPRLDFKVKFNMTGPHYLWVLGSDNGAKELHLGLDGVVTTNSFNIGGEDGAFGSRGQGELQWVGTNNAGAPEKWVNKSYLNVPSAVDHTVNIFIQLGGLWVDKILLTTNAAWRPEPLYTSGPPGGEKNGGATNIPPTSWVGSALLSVAITQPAGGKVFIGNSNLVVTLAARAVTNGLNSVTKMEFFAKKQPSGANTKLGEKTGAPPWMFGWTNPAVGIYDLTAKVTDNRAPPNNVKTSTVVTVEIRQPPIYTTPLIWTTNNFGTGLGTWTLISDNHASGFIRNLSEGWVFNWFFDLDWKNSALCGGSPGEFGGHVERMASVAPYVAEPLARRVSLNEELWFRGRGYKRNYGPDGATPPATNKISANSDTLLGYFDSTVFGYPPRIGLKNVNPQNTYPNPGMWRMRIENKPGYDQWELGAIVAETNAFEFELHWIPSGSGDGSGTMNYSVAGVTSSKSYGPQVATYDAFGFIAPSQGGDEPWRQRDEYFDNMEYLMPAVQKLEIQLLSSTQTLLSWAIPDHILQSADGALPTSRTNGWADVPGPYANLGGKYYCTNTIGASARWFQLRHPLPPPP